MGRARPKSISVRFGKSRPIALSCNPYKRDVSDEIMMHEDGNIAVGSVFALEHFYKEKIIVLKNVGKFLYSYVNLSCYISES